MKNGEKRYVAHLPFGTASKDINSAVFEIGRCLASRWKNCHELVTVMPEDKIITVQGLVCKKQLLAALIAAFISSLTRLHPFGHTAFFPEPDLSGGPRMFLWWAKFAINVVRHELRPYGHAEDQPGATEWRKLRVATDQSWPKKA